MVLQKQIQEIVIIVIPKRSYMIKKDKYCDNLPLCETSLNKGALNRLKDLKVFTVGDLRRLGSLECYKKMKERVKGKTLSKCYNYYDLEAVIRNRVGGWKSLTKQEKYQLYDQLNS